MSTSYNIFYSPEALEDIRKIYSYIAYELQVPETALNQVNRIRNQIRSLDCMPMRYSLVDWEPWKSMQMHKVPVDNYVVYYTINDDTLEVNIIRIFYAGQDVENITKSDS